MSVNKKRRLEKVWINYMFPSHQVLVIYVLETLLGK